MQIYTIALFRNVFPLYLLNVNHSILKFKLSVLDVKEPSRVAARCKAWIDGCSLAGTAGSNAAGGMDILSRVSVIFCQVGSLRRTDVSSEGGLPIMHMCVRVCH
jgi:hypothetical protein